MKTFLFSFVLLISHLSFAFPPDTLVTPDTVAHQKIYHINKAVVWSIIGVGAITDAFAISRIKNKPAITDLEIAALNPDILDLFDRWALEQDISTYKTYKQISDFGQIPIFILPGLLAFDKHIRKDWKDILLMYAEGHIITFSVYNYSQLGPTFQNKYRPYVYYDEFPMEERKRGYYRSSFYSGHVASCAFASFFAAKIYCDYHPEMKAGKFWWYAAASVPPLAMSYFRVRSLDHFPSDNLVGLALGAAIGIIVPELHKFKCKEFSIGMATSPETMGLSLRWLPAGRHAF